jgi:hypothetical protein
LEMAASEVATPPSEDESRSLAEAVRAHLRDQADENSRLEELLEDQAKQSSSLLEALEGLTVEDCAAVEEMLEEVCNGEFEKKLALM